MSAADPIRAHDVGYVAGLRKAADWLTWMASDPESTGLDPTTMGRLIDGAEAMVTSAAGRLGVDNKELTG